jgi:hypothetical protein
MKKGLFLSTAIIGIAGGMVVLVGFYLLMVFFGYPDIIRQPPSILLERLYVQRDIVPYLYYIGVGGAGLCIFFFSILLSKLLNASGEGLLSDLGRSCGMVTGVLLYIGIIRYTFLFPDLAEIRHLGTYDKDMVDLVFKAINRYVGDSVAEHAQFTFTGLMMLFFSISILKTKLINKWVAYFGVVVAIMLIYGNLEFFGAPGAFTANRIASDLVAVWLVAAGVALGASSFRKAK